MHIPRRHALKQGAVIRAMVGAALPKRTRSTRPSLPTPAVSAIVPPRAPALVRDYLRHLGVDPRQYRGELPAHLFPQWAFPLLMNSLSEVPYDMRRALNGGCRLVLHHPIPMGEPLHLRARIESIDDNGSRAIVTQNVWTSTPSTPDALSATMRLFVPLNRGKKGKKTAKPRVPEDGRAIDTWSLHPRVGREFALLTGDINPIHWIPAVARLAGFKNTINHGFSTLARAIESLNTGVFSGDPYRLAAVDVRFTRPVVLPARPSVFVAAGNQLSVGEAPGGPCYLTGTYEVRS